MHWNLNPKYKCVLISSFGQPDGHTWFQNVTDYNEIYTDLY